MSFLNRMKRLLQASALCTLLIGVYADPLTACSADQSEISTPDEKGVIDIITYDGRHINAQGWAVANQQDNVWTEIQIKLADKVAYLGDFETTQRPDVAEHFHRPDWLKSGWKVTFDLPEDIEPGTYPTEIKIRDQSGHWLKIDSSTTSKSLTITKIYHEQRREALKIKIWIACAAIFLILAFSKTHFLKIWINQKFQINPSEPLLFSVATLLVFLLFVSLGMTGSSLPLGLQATPSLQADMTHIFAVNQPIRGDEWSVVTPSAIAQYNHTPPFPVINKNLGEDGQNMLILGLSGVPVAHVSALSKPATWGFFIFDLKRALAWYWWFPVFGCFLALAFTLNTLCPDDWRKSSLFSVLLVTSPNSVAWSNWPAYTVFFPSMIFLSAFWIMKSSNRLALMGWGLMLGLSIAGFFLILFPSLQVSVGYVFVALIIGIILRDRLYKDMTGIRAMTYAASIAVAGIILVSWWMDARDAIHTMANTVYPGRRVSSGAGMSMTDILRGFSNISTLEHIDSTVTNQSEIASFYLLLLPLLAAFLIRLAQTTLTALEWSLALIILFILSYMLIGLPEVVSNAILWGRVPSKRADLSLGLACLLLTHLLTTSKNRPVEASSLMKGIACVVAVTWSYVVYQSLDNFPASIRADLDTNISIAILLITATTGYYLITNKAKPFLWISLGLSLVSTIHFNPINIAPLNVSTQIPQEIRNRDHSGPERILVLGSFVSPMFFAASGIPIAAGTFYYPQHALWHRLDPGAGQSNIYNRYQRIVFSGNDSVASYTIDNPSTDVVRINTNLQTFDFNKSGATILLAPNQEKQKLGNNSSLSFAASANGWSWFTIKPI